MYRRRTSNSGDWSVHLKRLFLAKMQSGADIGLIRRLGSGFGSSLGLGIGCSVTADQNEITAKRRVSGYRAHFSRQSSSMLTRDVRRNGSGSTIVAMMQTTQPWH
jgi:hypothetical protein